MITAVALMVNLGVMPLLLSGLMRKTKAIMQTRMGAPVLQPFYDLVKFLRKGEVISTTSSGVFTWSPRIGLAIVLLVAVLTPWSGIDLPAGWSPATNFILIVYLLSTSRFLALISAMDAGSAFGGLGASREATLAVLVEPALIIGLGTLALDARSMDLAVIYAQPMDPMVALLVGIAFLVVALAELSRMPVDDPTTHLELTMVHEAMILEHSGRNLALVECAAAVRACLYLGLAAHTWWHVWPGFTGLAFPWRYVAGLGGLLVVGVAVAIAEGVLVKLRWRSVPQFLLVALGCSLCAAFVAVMH